MPAPPREKRQVIRDKDRPSEEFVAAVEGSSDGLYDREYYFRDYVEKHYSRSGKLQFQEDVTKWLRTRLAQAHIAYLPSLWPFGQMARIQEMAQCLDAVVPHLESAFVHLSMYLSCEEKPYRG